MSRYPNPNFQGVPPGSGAYPDPMQGGAPQAQAPGMAPTQNQHQNYNAAGYAQPGANETQYQQGQQPDANQAYYGAQYGAGYGTDANYGYYQQASPAPAPGVNGASGYPYPAQGGYAPADVSQKAGQGYYDDVNNLTQQMDQTNLGGRPMPPSYGAGYGAGYGAAPQQPPQAYDQAHAQGQAPENLPRPKFDSDSVMARLNDLDAKVLENRGGAVGSQQLQVDAYGRPIPGAGGPQGGRTWPPTAACPPDLYRPPSKTCSRLTTAAFPNSSALLRKYGLPMGAVIKPMEDSSQLPLVNFSHGVVRCRRCRSYINYMCKFTDDGRRWRCSMCGFMNDTLREYYAPLDRMGYRNDVTLRPELCYGSFEVEAPSQYMLRPPMPPVYLFLLEVTRTSIESGLLSAAVAGIRDSLDALPNDGRTGVGIMTFDNTVQFYRFKGSEPSVVILPDVEDMFVPTPDQVVVPLQENIEALKQLLEKLPTMYAEGSGTSAAMQVSCFGAALTGAQKAIEHCGGRIVTFINSRPTLGPGQVKDRSDNTAIGTDRERNLLSPDESFYKVKAVELSSKFQIAVDLFMCPLIGTFLDVATLAPLAKYTGGEMYYNPAFNFGRDGHLLVESIRRALGRECGWEGVMRIRASKGVRCKTFHGRFFLKTTDLLALPTIDPDKSFAVEFAYDESVLEHDVFSIQIALLYTTSKGERRIRVHTVCVPVVSNLNDLFLYTDVQATTNLIARKAAEALRDSRLEDVRRTLTDPMIQALAAYRQSASTQFTSASASGVPFGPDSLSLFPLMIQGLLKSPLFSRDASGYFGLKLDDKSALLHVMNTASSALTTSMTYPTFLPLYPLDDYPEAGVYTEDENGVIGISLPPAIPAAKGALRSDFVLLVDDGISSIVWIGQDASYEFCNIMFAGSGENDLYALGRACIYGDIDGPSGRIRAIIRNVRGVSRTGAPLHVVLQNSEMQPRVEALMVEERTSSQNSYKDFLADVRSKVSSRTLK